MNIAEAKAYKILETSFYPGNTAKVTKRTKITPEQKSDKNRIKALERELRRKEKALAEIAALLELGKSSMPIGRKKRTDNYADR